MLGFFIYQNLDFIREGLTTNELDKKNYLNHMLGTYMEHLSKWVACKEAEKPFRVTENAMKAFGDYGLKQENWPLSRIKDELT